MYEESRRAGFEEARAPFHLLNANLIDADDLTASQTPYCNASVDVGAPGLRMKLFPYEITAALTVLLMAIGVPDNVLA